MKEIIYVEVELYPTWRVKLRHLRDRVLRRRDSTVFIMPVGGRHPVSLIGISHEQVLKRMEELKAKK